MEAGKLWKDSLGHHPFARSSWIGKADWLALNMRSPVLDDPDEEAEWKAELLALSVPSGLDWLVDTTAKPRALITFLPWRDSGIGLFTMANSIHAVVAVLDLAGRGDLLHLAEADAQGRLLVAACSSDVSPTFPLRGLSPAIREAGGHRRLAARELTEAIEDLRWLLRSPALYHLCGLPSSELELESLTLNVCHGPYTGSV